MRRRFAATLALALLALAVPRDAHAQERIVVAGAQDSRLYEASEAVLEEAYGRLGIELEFRYFAATRSIEESSSGRADAELQRISGVSAAYPSLIRVPVPINVLRGAALTLDPSVRLAGLVDLRAYRVGIVDGIIFFDEALRGANLVKAADYESLVQLLLDGEVEVIVASRTNSRDLIDRARLEHPEAPPILRVPGVLQTAFLYHYLHERHAALVPDLTRELKRMLLSGETQRILAEVLGEEVRR